MSNKAVTKIQAFAASVIIIIAVIGVSYFYMVTQQPSTAEEVTIGVVLPLTGGNARFGELCRQLIIIAGEEVNEAGGIKSLGGAKINLVFADATGDPKVAASEAERLILQYSPVAILGAYASSLSLTVSEVCERYKTPFITGSCTSALTKSNRTYTFQLNVYCQDFGIYAVDFAVEYEKATGKKIRNIALIYEDSAWGVSQAPGVRQEANKKGLNIVLDESYPSGFTDAMPLMTKVKNANPDIILCAPYLTDAILIVRAYNQLGIKAPIIGVAGGFAHPDFYKSCGEIAENMLVTLPISWRVNETKYQRLVELEKKYMAYSAEPFCFEHAPYYYSGVWIIKEAIERCKSTDTTKIRDAILELDLTYPHPAVVSPGSDRIKFCSSQEMEPIYDYQKGFYTHGFGHNIYQRAIVAQWHEGVLYAVWPKEIASREIQWPS
jgi:branched-chain amino acid transport system substrate-binding protein